MKKIPDIINRLLNVCGQMEVGALLTCRSGIKFVNTYTVKQYCFIDIDQLARPALPGHSCCALNFGTSLLQILLRSYFLLRDQ